MPLPNHSWLFTIAVVAVASACPGCYWGPDFEDVRSTFATHADSLGTLEAMLEEDYVRCNRKGGSRFITISSEYICGFSLYESSWYEVDKYGRHADKYTSGDGLDTLWSDIELEDVLGELEISPGRYQRYIDLIHLFGSEKISFAMREDGPHYLEMSLGSWSTPGTHWSLYIGRFEDPPYEAVETITPRNGDTGCAMIWPDWYMCQWYD